MARTFTLVPACDNSVILGQSFSAQVFPVFAFLLTFWTTQKLKTIFSIYSFLPSHFFA